MARGGTAKGRGVGRGDAEGREDEIGSRQGEGEIWREWGWNERTEGEEGEGRGCESGVGEEGLRGSFSARGDGEEEDESVDLESEVCSLPTAFTVQADEE